MLLSSHVLVAPAHASHSQGGGTNEELPDDFEQLRRMSKRRRWRRKESPAPHPCLPAGADMSNLDEVARGDEPEPDEFSLAGQLNMQLARDVGEDSELYRFLQQLSVRST